MRQFARVIFPHTDNGFAINTPSAHVVDLAIDAAAQQRCHAAEAYLHRRLNFERTDPAKSEQATFRLETMRQLLALRCQPQLTYPVIHVAGTKGKGSVVTMIGSILAHAGYRVGLYRSPHLETVRERLALHDQIIEPLEFVELIEALQEPVAEIERLARGDSRLHPPTYFEILTAAAFEFFRNRRVDVAVVEVGLGGRLDSTNVCQPALTVITNIGIDHQRQLGATKPLIAAEKAGIVKPGVPLICGVREADPAAVIARIAAEQGAPVCWMGRDFRSRIRATRIDRRLEFSVFGSSPAPFRHRQLWTPLYGRHQVANASLAVAAAQTLLHSGWRIDPPAIRHGLQSVSLPGRFQLIDHDPPVVIDVAHNEMSARALVTAVADRYPQVRPRVLVLSASKDKRIRPMMRALLPEFDHLILTSIEDNPRACELPRLESFARGVIADAGWSGGPPPTIESYPSQAEAWTAACGRGGGLIVVTGSLYLVGQMMPRIRREKISGTIASETNP